MKRIPGAAALDKILRPQIGQTLHIPCSTEQGILPGEVRVTIEVDETRKSPISHRPVQRIIRAFTPQRILTQRHGSFFIPVTVIRHVFKSKPKPGITHAQIFIPGNNVHDNFGEMPTLPALDVPISWLVKVKITQPFQAAA